MESQQLTQYNAQYTVYSGRNDITIYEIISLANLAKENNALFINIILIMKMYIKYKYSFRNIKIYKTNQSNEKQNLINLYNAVDNNGNLITNLNVRPLSTMILEEGVRLVKFEI